MQASSSEAVSALVSWRANKGGAVKTGRAIGLGRDGAGEGAEQTGRRGRENRQEEDLGHGELLPPGVVSALPSLSHPPRFVWWPRVNVYHVFIENLALRVQPLTNSSQQACEDRDPSAKDEVTEAQQGRETDELGFEPDMPDPNTWA